MDGLDVMTTGLTHTEDHSLRRYLSRAGWSPGEVDATLTGDMRAITRACPGHLHDLAWHVDLWATARELTGRACPAGIDLADRIRTTAEQERTP